MATHEPLGKSPSLRKIGGVEEKWNRFEVNIPNSFLAPAKIVQSFPTATFKGHKINGKNAYVLHYMQTDAREGAYMHQVVSFIFGHTHLKAEIASSDIDRESLMKDDYFKKEYPYFQNGSKIFYNYGRFTTGYDPASNYDIGIYQIYSGFHSPSDNRKQYFFADWNNTAVDNSSAVSMIYRLPKFTLPEKYLPQPAKFNENNKISYAFEPTITLNFLNLQQKLFLLITPTCNQGYTQDHGKYAVLEATADGDTDQFSSATNLGNHFKELRVHDAAEVLNFAQLPAWAKMAKALDFSLNIRPNDQRLIAYYPGTESRSGESNSSFYYTEDFPQTVKELMVPAGYRFGFFDHMAYDSEKNLLVADLRKFDPAKRNTDNAWSMDDLAVVSFDHQEIYPLSLEKDAANKRLFYHIANFPVISGDYVYFIGTVTTPEALNGRSPADRERTQIFKVPLKNFKKNSALRPYDEVWAEDLKVFPTATLKSKPF